MSCAALIVHCVILTWTPSSTSGATYDVLRSETAGGPYTQLNAEPIAGTMFEDDAVTPGQTYFYVVTANLNGNASLDSNEVDATIPAPDHGRSLKGCCD